MPRSSRRASRSQASQIPAAWVYYTLTIVGVVAAIVSAVILIQMRVERSSASFGADATSTYNEDFSTATFKDPATTLNWNTGAGRLELNRASGVVRNFDLATAGTQAVTATAGFGETTVVHSITLDSQDRQIISFVCDNGSGGGAACVTRWNGTQFTKMDGVTAGADLVSSNDLVHVVYTVSIDLNPVTGQPCIAYEQEDAGGKTDVNVTCWTGSAWQGQLSGTPGVPDNVTGTPGASESNPSIRIDSAGRAVVAYQDDAGFSADIYVAHNNGAAYVGYLGAADDQLTSSGDFEANPRLLLDSSNQPNVLYSDSNVGDVFFTRLNGGVYKQLTGAAGVQNISNNAGNSLFPDFALRANNNPVFAWTQVISAPNRQIWYTEWNGTSLVQSDGATAGSEVIVTGNSNGNTSMDVDANGDAGLCFLKAGVDGGAAPDTYCIMHQAAGWVQPGDRTTAGPLNVSSSNSIFNGNPTVIIDSFGDINFAYQEEVSGTNDVKGGLFVRDRINALALSTVVDTTTDNITAATITATETLNGGTDSYSLSNDCSTFAAATLGSPLTFATTGSSLCWKVDVARSASDPRRSPVIDALSISYETLATQVVQPSGDTVTRIEGSNPTEQSIKVSQAEFADHTADCGIVARNDNMSDAFVGAQLSTSKNAPILLNRTDKLDDAVKAELQRALKPSACIFVLGREVAQADQVITDIKAAGFSDVTRLGGRDRRETALRIDNKLLGDGLASGRVVLAEDLKFVDTLGMSAIAADVADGKVDVTILTDRGQTTLNSFAKQYLNDHKSSITEVVLIGGNDALASSMEQTLTSAFPSITSIKRIGGVDRYATNADINTAYATAPTAIVVASGNKSTYPAAQSVDAPVPAPASPNLTGDSFFFAALLSGPFAAKLHAPLLLTESGALPGQIETYIRNHAATITSATIVGTLEQISQAVQDFIGSII